MGAAEPLIPRKSWTRAEADLIPSGTLSLELINGELIDKMGKRPPHSFWKTEIRDWLGAQFGNEYVRSEDPIDVAPEDNPTSEPEPDVAVTTLSRRQTRGANPTPSQLRLVVEISDSTYRLDTQVKGPLYARAGIREYWVVDVRVADAPSLTVYREPKRGRYGSVRRHGYSDEVAVLDGRVICLERLTASE